MGIQEFSQAKSGLSHLNALINFICPHFLVLLAAKLSEFRRHHLIFQYVTIDEQ